MNGIEFENAKMIAPNGLLEFDKRQSIGNECLARIQIDVDIVNLESRQIMKSQMRNGGDEGINLFEIRFRPRSANLVKQISKKAWVNFAPTQHIAGIARHAPTVFTHPLQIMRIVSAKFKLASVPRPKPLALGAKHLVAALSLVNKNLAIGAGFSVLLQQGDGCKRVGIANMLFIIPGSLEFPAMRTGVLVA